jgi:hypothetical protein
VLEALADEGEVAFVQGSHGRNHRAHKALMPPLICLLAQGRDRADNFWSHGGGRAD